MEERALLPLCKRADFLRVQRDGKKYFGALFLIKKKKRSPDFSAVRGRVRVGFTITRKNGNAVVRNRIKRRLKAAIKKLSLDIFSPATDYVFIARSGILQVSFSCLVQEIIYALRQLKKKTWKSPIITDSENGI